MFYYPVYVGTQLPLYKSVGNSMAKRRAAEFWRSLLWRFGGSFVGLTKAVSRIETHRDVGYMRTTLSLQIPSSPCCFDKPFLPVPTQPSVLLFLSSSMIFLKSQTQAPGVAMDTGTGDSTRRSCLFSSTAGNLNDSNLMYQNSRRMRNQNKQAEKARLAYLVKKKGNRSFWWLKAYCPPGWGCSIFCYDDQSVWPD